METKGRVKKYKTQSIHYLENAFNFIEVSDLEKASEFIWGSVAEALKAVAASKEIWLKHHKDLRDYAMELARTLPDESIRHTFLHAQSLHSNFYETGLLMEDVVMCAEEVRTTINKLFKLIDGRE